MRRENLVSTCAIASLLAAAGLGLGLARAQGEDPSAEAEATPVTPDAQLARGREVVERATQLVRSIGAMLDEAREEGDIIRVTCLNDKLAQGNATARTVEERQGYLQEAVTEGDAGRREHEFTMVQVLDQKLDVLEAEAGQCVGQDLFETGDTVVTVDIDPNTPAEDPTVLPTVVSFPFPFIPPPASGVI